MKTALYLLAAALMGAASAAADDQRLEDYVQRHGRRDLGLVTFLESVWPGAALAKVSEGEFLALLAGAPAPLRALAPGRALETFRLLQEIATGARRTRPGRLRWTRPLPAAGAHPWSGAGASWPEALVRESEPNDEPDRADDFTCADTVAGAIAGLGDLDYFRLTIPAGIVALSARVLPGTSGPISDPSLEILDAQGARVAFNDDFNGTYPQIDIHLPAGAWFFLVRGFATSAGSYLLDPGCGAPSPLGCGASRSGPLGFREQRQFLIDVPRDDEVVLEATRTAGLLGLEILVRAQDLIEEIARGELETAPGQVELRLALRAGIYAVEVRETSHGIGSYRLDYHCSGAGIAAVSCGGAPLALVLGRGERAPGALVQAPGVRAVSASVSVHGGTRSTLVRLEDPRGNALFEGLVPARASASIDGILGAGGMIRLLPTGDPSAPAVTWRDSTYARRWSRPAPSAGAYAGPTDLMVAASTGFVFSDEHISPAGILTLRHARCFDVDGAGFDIGIFIDEAFVEVDAGSGPVRLHPVAARWQPAGQVAWGHGEQLGGAAELAADDGLYYATTLADSSGIGTAELAIEMDYDLSALGVRGSQLLGLRAYLEWYFGGNPTSGGGVQSPPGSDDSSEESNLLTCDLELARSGGAAWDLLGAVLDPARYQPPGPCVPSADVSLSCQPLSPRAASAEDLSPGGISAQNPRDVFSFGVSSPSAVEVFTSSPAPAVWDGHPYALAWAHPGIYYPGPILQSVRSALPPATVGPGGVMRLRLRKHNCWSGTLWDDHHYYDLVRLDLDLGGGPLPFHPAAWTLGGDRAYFTSSGVTLGPGGLADLSADDDVYGHSDWVDYDAGANPPDATYWDEFDFDVSSILGAGGGGAIARLDLLAELYLCGGGAFPSPSLDSSEERYLREVEIEIYDFSRQGWFDLDPAPILDPARYGGPSTCSPTLGIDTCLQVIDARSGVLLARGDDQLRDENARVRYRQGSAASGVQEALLIVEPSPKAAAGRSSGGYELGVQAGFGYAGSRPGAVRLGASLTIRIRGADGDLAFAFHSLQQHLSPPAPLAPPIEGFLVVNIAGLYLTMPAALPIANGRAELAFAVPNLPVLLGARTYAQGGSFALNPLRVRFENEDEVVIIP